MVFRSDGLSLRAALGVFRTNTQDGTLNWEGERGGEGECSHCRQEWQDTGDLFGVMVKVVLTSFFKCSAEVDDFPPLRSSLYWVGQSLPHTVVLQPLEVGSQG